MSNVLLNNKIGKWLFETQLYEKYIPLICGAKKFWTDVLSCWCKFNREKIDSRIDVENQILRNSSHIY